MANHTLDCEFCGEDQRLNSRCCQKSRGRDDFESREKSSNESKLYKYENLFNFHGLTSKIEFFNFVYDNLDKIPNNPYSKRVKGIESKEKKEKECSHKYENGESAWKSTGGFIYETVECKICGKEEVY